MWTEEAVHILVVIILQARAVQEWVETSASLSDMIWAVRWNQAEALHSLPLPYVFPALHYVIILIPCFDMYCQAFTYKCDVSHHLRSFSFIYVYYSDNAYWLLVEQLKGGTLRPPQDPPRLVPKCAPGCIFWYFWCSQENNIGEIWVSDQFCTTMWWKNEHFWDGGWGRLTLYKNQTVQPIYTCKVSA